MNCNLFELSDALALFAIAISLVTFIFSFLQNKKSRKIEIQTSKLEELLELILELSKYYPKFKKLYLKLEILRDSENNEIETISDYKKIRDIELSVDDKLKIDKLLSRIEVLYISYTNKKLKETIQSYYNMMDIFYTYIINSGDFKKEIKYPNGFPNYNEVRVLIDNIIVLLKKEIHKYN